MIPLLCRAQNVEGAAYPLSCAELTSWRPPGYPRVQLIHSEVQTSRRGKYSSSTQLSRAHDVEDTACSLTGAELTTWKVQPIHSLAQNSRRGTYSSSFIGKGSRRRRGMQRSHHWKAQGPRCVTALVLCTVLLTTLARTACPYGMCAGLTA